MGSEALPSACYILSDESSIPSYSTSNGYNYHVGKASVLKFLTIFNPFLNMYVNMLFLHPLTPKKAIAPQ